MLDLHDCKLPRLRQVYRTLFYLGYSSTGKEEDSEQGEENAPGMDSMDDCSPCSDSDTQGSQRLSRISAVDEAQSCGDGDVGTD